MQCFPHPMSMFSIVFYHRGQSRTYGGNGGKNNVVKKGSVEARSSNRARQTLLSRYP